MNIFTVWKRQKLVVLYDKKKSSINYMKLRMNAFREMNNVTSFFKQRRTLGTVGTGPGTKQQKV